MKPRDYCCCAIPLVNAGIYTTLLEQFVLGILVGVLSMATPSIVGAATPSFAPWVLGIIAFAAAGLQILGFIGVSKEKTITFRRYVTLHSLVTSGGFAVAAAWIIISATRHDTGKSRCLAKFFSGEDSGEGEALCDIFSWATVGIMGGLWLVLAIMQFYLYLVLSSYGSSQRRDHDQYLQLGDPVNADAIPMVQPSDTWDARPAGDLVHAKSQKSLGHVRQQSSLSVSDVMSQPAEQPKDSLGYQQYGYQNSRPAYGSYNDVYEQQR